MIKPTIGLALLLAFGSPAVGLAQNATTADNQAAGAVAEDDDGGNMGLLGLLGLAGLFGLKRRDRDNNRTSR